MLALSPDPWESGVVIAADIARYQPGTTAEVTQGAGAAALLVQRSPRLLELEPGLAGYCSQDVDDFFRPVGSTTAQVKGSYSMECYLHNLEQALQDHSRRRGLSAREVLASTDLFVLHAPFRNMPELAMQRLLDRHLGLNGPEARGFLEQRGFFVGLDPLADIGNTYSASLYLFLAHLLADRCRAWGRGIVGRRILLVSYGSGNTMVVLSGRVAPGAPEVIGRWNLGRIREDRLPAGMREYGIWSSGSHVRTAAGLTIQDPILPPGRFYLSGLRQDGYREYRPATEYREHGLPEAAEPRQPVPASN
jgi:hydroxymethylglutaryl-CoA synthase